MNYNMEGMVIVRHTISCAHALPSCDTLLYIVTLRGGKRGVGGCQTWRSGMESPSWRGRKFIFRLRMYILSLRIHIFNLRMCIFSLEIKKLAG